MREREDADTGPLAQPAGTADATQRARTPDGGLHGARDDDPVRDAGRFERERNRGVQTAAHVDGLHRISKKD